MQTITLKHPVKLPPAAPGSAEQKWEKLELRDIEAGDIIDAGRELPDEASQTEMQLRVAGRCADIPFVIIRKLKPADIVQIEAWWRSQWAAADGSGDEKKGDDAPDGDENPLKAGGTRQAS